MNDKVDLIENAEFGYCSLIKATENILSRLDIENITKTEITSSLRKEKRLVKKPRCQTLSYEALSYLVGQVIKDLAKKFVRFLHF